MEKTTQSGILLEKLINQLDALGVSKHGRGVRLAAASGYSTSLVSDVLNGKKNCTKRFFKLASEGLSQSEQLDVAEAKDQPSTVAEQIGKGYTPEVRLAADYLEVKLKGRTADERLKFVEEVMEEIRRKYK